MTVSYNSLDESESTVLADIDRSASPRALCDVYLVLDLTTDELYWTTTHACERNSTPTKVWHGRAIRWRLQGCPTAAAANALASDVLPLCEAILAGYSEEWDGSNHVGRLNEAATDARDSVTDELSSWDAEGGLVLWDAAEWLGGNTPDGDMTPDAIVAEALDDGAVLDVGEVEAHLLEVAEGRDGIEIGAYTAAWDHAMNPRAPLVGQRVLCREPTDDREWDAFRRVLSGAKLEAEFVEHDEDEGVDEYRIVRAAE